MSGYVVWDGYVCGCDVLVRMWFGGSVIHVATV
jgi:hypothetical protein